MDLKELKAKYIVFEKKYKLPSFNSLNEDFEIEKITLESDLVLRVIRKLMMDKIIGFLNFFERLSTNPSGMPRIYFPYIKAMNADDKAQIDKIYDALGEVNLLSFELEISFNEKQEAEMIKRIFVTWNALKPDLLKVVKRIEHPDNHTAKKEKSYFG
jgi:hypothetical protein